jgi:hypothetical protein
MVASSRFVNSARQMLVTLLFQNNDKSTTTGQSEIPRYPSSLSVSAEIIGR